MKNLRITVEGQVYDVVVEAVGDSTPAAAPQAAPQAAAPVAAAPVAPAPAPVATGGTPIPAPLSAVVVEIHVSAGQQINAGDKVATIEAMKMNTIVSAPSAGTVSSIVANKGDAVEEGAPLIILS